MFVVFEGIDGSGKTTISNAVARQLKQRGMSVKHLRADGKFVSSVSEAIRSLARDSRHLDLVPQAEFMLYVARDLQLIEQALRPALREHDVVLADRFLFTPQVLGRHGRHLPPAWVDGILRIAAGGLSPDLVVLVDVDPSFARARRKSAKLAVFDPRPPSRKGLAGVGLQHRVRRGYLELAAEDPERWVVIENDGALEQTIASVTALIEDAARISPKQGIARFRANSSGASGRRRFVAPSVEAALGVFLSWLDERIEREPQVAAYVLSGLYGEGIDARRRAIAERAPEAALRALCGLDDPESWQLREKLVKAHPAAVARTLVGLPNTNSRVRALRSELLAVAELEVLRSMSRLDDELAWAHRERMFDRYAHQVVTNLAGLDSEAAWRLRERWLERYADAIEGEYEAAKVICRSLTGLGSERAWQLRQAAYAQAPVAALGSLTAVFDERSWSWRERHIRTAPKSVMKSLRRVDDERAWQLRRAVADDCKEAIDSLAGMPQAEAWELREQYKDSWPSTVVKTLGPLADEPRGRALVARQLELHADSISLLRHVSAIALGTHRQTRDEEDE